MPGARSRPGVTKGGMTLGLLDLPVAPMEAVGNAYHDAMQEMAMTRNRPGWRALAVLLLALPLAATAQDACPDRSSYAPARGIIADLGRIVAPDGVQEDYAV